jgi:hypothetical protein
MNKVNEFTITAIRDIATKLENRLKVKPTILDQPFEIRVLDTHVNDGVVRKVEVVIDGVPHIIQKIFPRIPE